MVKEAVEEKAVASSSSNKKFYWKNLLHSRTELYTELFFVLVVTLLLAIVFIRFGETDYQQNRPEDASVTIKVSLNVSLKQPRVIEIVKWHQPICVIPGKDVSPCLPSQEKIQVGYQHSRAEKSEDESDQELADLDRIPEVLKAPEMDIEWQSVIRNEPNSLTRLTRSISPNIPGRTRPSRIYVTKVLDLPVTPVSITHGCLPNDLRLCADYQANFSSKIIKKEEDELIQSNDQNLMIQKNKKNEKYLGVPPKVKIINKENHSKIVDLSTTYQPISHTDYDKFSYQSIFDMKINTIKPTEDHQPEISITEPIEKKTNRKSKVNYSKITDDLKHELHFSDRMEHSKYIPEIWNVFGI